MSSLCSLPSFASSDTLSLDEQREQTYEDLLQFAPARHFAPTKVWTDPQLRKTAFELLDVVQHAMESINVEHCVFYGTLLGTVRQGGPVSFYDLTTKTFD